MKLLCTYEEWLDKKNANHEFIGISDKAARALSLSLKFDRTQEEDDELDNLNKELNNSNDDIRFTELSHKITDMCINPKNHDIDFEEIGRMAFDLERMKYPVVVPKNGYIKTNKED